MGGCNPSRSRRYNVNGTSRSGTTTLIDGAASAHIWNVGNSAIVPALEAIETVSVSANSFDAEQGLAGGALVSVQIKSGTNDFHGSAFEYHHNQHLRARTYFLPADQGKGKFISNQYGGTLGGPIVRNKVFFFGSIERRHERENSTAILSVPGAAVRTGDFSAFEVPMYDPLTGDANGIGRTPFANNRIPAERISAISKNILSRVPLPNLSNTQEINNFFASVPFAANNWALDTKSNWYITDNLNVFGSVSMFGFNITNPTAFGEEIDGPRVGGGNAGYSHGRNTRLSFGANKIFTPTLLMDAFVGFNRQNTNVEQPGLGTDYGVDVLGIPGTNGPEFFQSGWPFFSIAGYAAIGTEEPWTPYFRNDDQYSMRANFTKTQGSHEIRWGADINTEQMNHTQPEFQGGNSMGEPAHHYGDRSAGIADRSGLGGKHPLKSDYPVQCQIRLPILVCLPRPHACHYRGGGDAIWSVICVCSIRLWRNDLPRLGWTCARRYRSRHCCIVRIKVLGARVSAVTGL